MAGACGVCCSVQHYKQVDFSSGPRVCLEGSWSEILDVFRRVDIV